MKLSQLRQATTEIVIPIGGGNEIRLHVWTRRGTVADQRALAQNINKAIATLNEKHKEAGKLDRERDALLIPVTEIEDKIAETQKQFEAENADRATLRATLRELEEKRAAKLEELEAPLQEFNERAQKLLEDGQNQLTAARATKLEYFVERHDITDDDGKLMPSKAEFYAENFDETLLETCAARIDEVLSGPLETSSPAPS